MPTYEDRGNLATDNRFRSQVLIALINAATAVCAEDVATGFHDQRRYHAVRVLQNPAGYVPAVAVIVAAQPGITVDGPSDNDIQFTVNSLWDALSVADDSNDALTGVKKANPPVL